MIKAPSEGEGGSGVAGGAEPPLVLTAAQLRQRRARSIAIALALGALVVLFYLVTIIKLGPGVLNRAI